MSPELEIRPLAGALGAELWAADGGRSASTGSTPWVLRQSGRRCARTTWW